MDSDAKQVDERVIELRRLSLGYPGRELLCDADTTFCAGTLTALIGRNGAGKSTLLRAIAGLNSHYTGQIIIDGDPSLVKRPERARHIAFVNTGRVRIANMTCRDIVALGRAPYTDWIGRLSDTDRQIVDQALDTVGMASFATRTLDTLSDGESQRVMIARAIAQDTPAIILDEPTSFLDLPGRYHLMQLLRDLAHRQRKCIVMSTHELDLALRTADSLALLADRRLTLLPTSDPATPSIITSAFGL